MLSVAAVAKDSDGSSLPEPPGPAGLDDFLAAVVRLLSARPDEPTAETGWSRQGEREGGPMNNATTASEVMRTSYFRSVKRLVALAAFAAVVGSASLVGAAETVVGRWTTVDENTGKVVSEVELYGRMAGSSAGSRA